MEALPPIPPFRLALREYRLRRSLSSKELAHKIGCCGSAYISAIERNLTQSISEDKIRKICDVLEMPGSDYFVYQSKHIPSSIQDFILKDHDWLHPYLLLLMDMVPKKLSQKQTFYSELYKSLVSLDIESCPHVETTDDQ